MSLLVQYLSLCSKRLCGTLSNAFEQSRSIMSTCSPVASFRAISSIVMMSCVSHDRFERKPCWIEVRETGG